MRLSLCIVARNEAAFLRDCIDSGRPVVDEVVVVDTGSSDGTPDIARDAGARVVRTAWPGDLGRAHNLPIEHARGDWVLSLDADEVLDPTGRHRLRALVHGNRHDAYRLPVRNYSYEPEPKWRPADPADRLARGALGYIPTRPVRLFRRREVYRFSGCLHQAVAPSVLQYGGRIDDADVPIHHYGFLRSDRRKSALYGSLARRQAAADPRDPHVWIELGIVLFSDDLPAALDAFRRARSLGLRPTAAFFMGWALTEMHRAEASIPFLREAIRGNPRDELVDYDRADAWELLGRGYEMLEKPQAAERAYRHAVQARPDSPVALNNLVGLLAERGAVPRAERFLQRLLVRYRGLAMPWATLGTLRLRRGDLAGGRRAFETALDIDPLCLPARDNLALASNHAGLRGRVGHCSSGSVPRRLRPLGPGTVVSLIAHLHDRAGRVLVDTVHALKVRPQLVLCGDTGSYPAQGFRAELAAAGVEILTVASREALRRALDQVRPGYVIHHWWNTSLFPGPARTGNERWIAIGHAALPMPIGYDAYIVLSEFHRQLQAHLPAVQLHRVPPGVDLQRFRRRPQRSGAPVTIAMLSQLEPGKFPRRLLDQLPPLDELGARLLVAGSGGRRYEIEPEIAHSKFTESVHFGGPLSSAQVPDFLARADIGLHLTETHIEVCSVAILEMMAAGVPVVAEPKGCLSEMIVPGKNGFLALDEIQIREHLRQLVLSPMLRKRMGAASRRMAIRYAMSEFRRSLRDVVGGLELG
jgi:glycosyltransferase involved in cell wall biosynthesis